MARAAGDELVIAGEALIDLLGRAGGELQPSLGGSPFNLALALGRLGCKVGYASPLSTDDYGERLSRALLECGVRITAQRVALPTSQAIVRVDAAGLPTYQFHREGVADRTLAPQSLLERWAPGQRFFHVGSLALIPPDGDAWCELLGALRARGVTTSVDVNMRPLVARDPSAYAATARRVAAQANWLKVSDDDLQTMGLDGDPLHRAAALVNDVTRAVVLTRGSLGAWCFSAEGMLHRPPERVDVVDTVGAGDCFYAGFLACLDTAGKLQERPSPELLARALSQGSRAAAFSLQRVGCQPPWLHELDPAR